MISKSIFDPLELSIQPKVAPPRNTTYRSGTAAKLVAWIAYPVIVGAGLVLHGWILGADFSLQISTYLPVIAAALIIAILEQKFPHRRIWLPKRSNLSSDLKYMAVVQILLPKLLSFFIASVLLKQVATHNFTLDFYWPHQASHIVQAVLMLLIADLLRYWLHRATHEWLPVLWRLHAVHHAPAKLYWLNVGRFHPLEKMLQFLLDAFPFILLGVSEQVIAIYFVFYAINGFFQHCNIELRLGVLNTIISGPELHRWHHSKVVQEANKNYGNNLIVWDLLFGSYFRPRGRQVQTIGL